MTGYFSVRNFEKFQHYKDRDPPWIKLYNSLLHSYEYSQLPDASRSHLIGIYLLASRTGNHIPADSDWLKSELHATDIVNLRPLLDGDFIVMDQDSSDLLAECGPNDTQRERQRQRQNKKPSPNGDPPLRGDALIKSAVAIWNDMAGDCGLAQIVRLTEPRRKAIPARLKEIGGLDGWRVAIRKIHENGFFHGENDRGWKADIDFLLRPKTMTKLMEGGYDRARAPAKPTSDDRRRAAAEGIARAFGGSVGTGPPGGLDDPRSSADGPVIDDGDARDLFRRSQGAAGV